MIWDNLTKYCEWSDRPLAPEEIAEIASVRVVKSLNRDTLEVTLKSGGIVYLGIEGPIVEPIDLSKSTIRTYQREINGKMTELYRIILSSLLFLSI